MDKQLFATQRGKRVPPADTKNAAGGRAYTVSAKEALAKYSATCMFGGTYYAEAGEQLREILEILPKVEPEFVAKCAVYSREQGWLKDMPALMLAHLTSQFSRSGNCPWDENKARASFRKAFPRIVDDSKMLRNFVQMVRSGVTGRKSFGSKGVRDVLRAWLLGRSDYQLFRDQVGDTPSLPDILKMVRPNPKKGSSREAFHQYILGKKLTAEHLAVMPRIVQEYETFKKSKGSNEPLPVPDVDFRQLDSLKLSVAEWSAVFRRAKWQFTRMNLNTALRQGVLQDPKMVELIANRLRDSAEVRRSRNFPYQLLQAWRHIDPNMPMAIKMALQDAVDASTENVPVFPGNTFVLLDTSGSMLSEFMKDQKGRPTQLCALDVGAMFAAAIVRKNPRAILLPFNTAVYAQHGLNPRDSVTTLVEQIKKLPSGGTDCSAPLAWINGNNPQRVAISEIDTVIFISDYESWVDSRTNAGYSWLGSQNSGTAMMQQWQLLKSRNPKAKLVCVDLTPKPNAQAPSAPDRLNVGGFNDNVFNVVARFLEKGLDAHWVSEIEALDLDVVPIRA